MNQYRRIVSYLYKYTNGVKGENTGFVRVDTREEGIRIHLSIKDLRMMDERKLAMYFYFHKNDQLQLIFVDEFPCVRGNCEYKKIVNPNLGEMDLDSLQGVVFLNQEKLLYGSCWDEQEIREDRLSFTWEKSEQKEGLETGVEQQEANTEFRDTKQKDAVTPEKSAKESVESGREPEEIEEELHTSEISMDNMEEKPIPPAENKSNEIVFEDAGNLIQAIRIELHDITRLQPQEWKLADNLFLKQAYEEEEHLMLARIQMQNGKQVWVLGVPGIYTNREKYLANLFGFADYIPLKQSDIRTGGQGYWIREVSL